MEPSTWFGPTTKLRRTLWNRLKPGWRVSTLVWAFYAGALFIEHHDKVGSWAAVLTMGAALAAAIVAAASD